MPLSKPAYKDRLGALRKALKAEGLVGFIIPRADEYLGEYIPPSSARLEWLTGFTGSAGVAIVLEKAATVLTDGRYTIQAAQEVDKKLFEHGNSTRITIADWLIAHAKGGDIIGYDPRLHSAQQVKAIEKALEGKNIEIRALAQNPLDAIWEGRPKPSAAPAFIFDEAVAGKKTAEKREAVAAELAKAGIFAAVITQPDSIAWLLNIRGGDLEYTPVVLSYAVIDAQGSVNWFVDPAKITPEIKKHIGSAVQVIKPQALAERLALLAAEAKKAGRPVGVDYKRSPAWFVRQLDMNGAHVRDFADPCVAMKAVKTEAEQQAIRAAHIRDGRAVVSFLAWLNEEADKGKLDEIAVADKLGEFRRAHASYKGPSFPTIAGYNANGTIVHYRASEKSNAKLKPPGLLLLDSGAQYPDGTTDITRTIAIGPPREEMRRHYTLVLKGHIAVARAHFPAGTTGVQVDALARQALWQENLDYAHGTGHGVGCYLSVHEEAASLSPRGREAIRAGMLLSNEPGYYKQGVYGIRIESLILAQEGEGETLYFETVTQAPLDRRLIAAEILTPEERSWVDDYHARVFESLKAGLPATVRDWLAAQTRPL